MRLYCSYVGLHKKKINGIIRIRTLIVCRWKRRPHSLGGIMFGASTFGGSMPFFLRSTSHMANANCSDVNLPDWFVSHSAQIWAKHICGMPDCMKTPLISRPDTKPSLSKSLLAKMASERMRSAGVTTQSPPPPVVGGDPNNDGTLFWRWFPGICGIGGMAGGKLLNTAGSGGTGGGPIFATSKFATKWSLWALALRALRCSSTGNDCGIARLSSAW